MQANHPRKEEEVIDVMDCVDKVVYCLERADQNSKACLEGIAKADMVLRESKAKGDTDIHGIVLIKRIELLFIAVS